MCVAIDKMCWSSRQGWPHVCRHWQGVLVSPDEDDLYHHWQCAGLPWQGWPHVCHHWQYVLVFPDEDDFMCHHWQCVLVSPDKDDLMCVTMDNVCWSSLTRMTSCVSPLTVCWSPLTRLTLCVSPLTMCAGLPWQGWPRVCVTMDSVLVPPDKNDLICITIDKMCWSPLTRMTSCVWLLTRYTGSNTRLKISCLLHRWRRSCIWSVSKFYRQPRKILGMFLPRKKETGKKPQWRSFPKYHLSDLKIKINPLSFADSYRLKGHWTYLKVTAHSYILPVTLNLFESHCGFWNVKHADGLLSKFLSDNQALQVNDFTNNDTFDFVYDKWTE